MFFCLFTLCSAYGSALLIVVTVHVKESENVRLLLFWKTECWCVFSWSIVGKTATLLGLSRATVSKVMSAYMNRRKTTSAKNNSGWKSRLTERDRKITELLQHRWQQNWMFLKSLPTFLQCILRVKGEAIPVTGRGGPYGCETSRLTFSTQSAHRWRWGCQPYALAALYSQEDSWYSLQLETESNPGT
jgi:hypothetical protein